MRYIYRPVEVEAYQVGGITPVSVIAKWCGCNIIKDGRKFTAVHVGGVMAYMGDFIVREGSEFYVMHETEFNKRFEKK
ncbi:MAG: hypothetical protein CV087_08270 [Candidatus Brocadia sp. WS118]|nr:MAG: hypothetical protein CV087_08270 [Candidatus Brocadia sp. WS118]